ncbi:reverse transcriptase family protein [Chondromyces apiculatus]|uniref:RNA-directed DNA polymerase n=1 Tax=Chondromyces apiculatus DSM 436 TaxID=1192034 RepID=A0A017T1K8_9BACT|nr:reverse transcriptase family protein [Chondromyces apiculatus]EYF02441.1 Retron-type RNA-directed DNA polymerase [Chondromyces apiculatus DSM 436]
MTAKIDPIVQAAQPAILPVTTAPSVKPAGTPEERQRAHEERVARWKAITEAGGIDAWVQAELTSRGLLVSGDPARMSERERSQWKERKKAEVKERRTLRRLAWKAYLGTHIAHLGQGVHWEDKKGADKFDVPQREERAKALGLPQLAGAEDLAAGMELSVARLRWLAFHREVDTGSHYRRWTIPKRDGSERLITAPKKELKRAQRWALRNVFEKLPVHGSAHGFLSARSIVTNAAVHAGADVVIKIDIKDFFPTVTWRRVRGLLRKAGLAEGPATLLALISTEAPREVVQFRGKTLYVASGPRVLPQGAPTSPAITNALCLRLDRRMAGLARKLGLRYTRYADDLTFSWKSPATGETSREVPRARAPIGPLLHGTREILGAEGFRLHPTKTAVMRRGDQQKVTGLVVNAAGPSVPPVRVPREKVRELRAAIRNRELGREGKGETLAQLKGLAAFVFMADPVRGRAFLDRLAALETRAGG